MAGSVNRVILVGNLGRDPEVRAMASGDRVANLALATSDVWRDKASGERKERTEWHRITIFNDHIVDVAEKYLRKGSKIYVEGSLQTRKYVDKDGQERYTTEVVLQKYRGELTMLDSARDSAESVGSGGDGSDVRRANFGGTGAPRRSALDDDLDDKVPF